ncbi:ATP-binding protein [Neorhizobium sp. DAR64872/K0K18]|uniref:ATP-binding protein n=1 Tax=Neorhizobium sp. DAR64872/K0K18 TaxID=3421958 RepID=UPI003D27CECA
MKIRLPQFLFMIHWQITLIIVLCLMIGVVGSAKLEQWVRTDQASVDLEEVSERISAIASLLSAASPAEQETIVAIANRTDGALSRQPIALAESFTRSSPDEPYIERLADWLFPPDGSTVPFGGWKTFLDGNRVVSARIGNSEFIVIKELPVSATRSDAITFGSNYLVALVTLIVIMTGFAIWTITRPLRRIAAAAMNADISSGPMVFPEQGSIEIMALGRALNAMQTRISSMVNARTAMLRGISHDLRTPLTRLRLRADRVAETEVRQALLVDIERIDKLLKVSLSYLRDSHQTEEAERVDLASVVKTICDDFEDTGHMVSYEGPDHLVLTFRPLAITRAVTNLCENATKFGTHVIISLSLQDGSAVIEVADDGPGIPEGDRQRVMEPFYKLDTARGGADHGFGLGLSIVQEIVQAHGGRFELHARHPNGLLAKLILAI